MCEKRWITGDPRPERRTDDVFYINILTSSTQFQLEESFQTLLSDLRRPTIWSTELTDCVNYIIKAIVWKKTASFQSEMRILIACSCSWQGVGMSEGTDLCSPPIFNYNSPLRWPDLHTFTLGHLLLACGAAPLRRTGDWVPLLLCTKKQQP